MRQSLRDPSKATTDRHQVESALVAFFRAQAGLPAPRLSPSPSGWFGFLDRDPEGCKYLRAWARCRANGESFGAYCREMGWNRATAEAGRRRAAVTIATRLMAESERAGSPDYAPPCDGT